MSPRPLRPYQEAALVRFAKEPSMFLAMEMRLGKTLTAIRWLMAKKTKPKLILVIAPKTVLIAWEQEAAKEGYGTADLSSPKFRKRGFAHVELDNVNFLLINPEAFRNDNVVSAFSNGPFDAIILDESTTIKNAKSKQTKGILTLSKRSKALYRVALSGLPNPENLTELWSQMAFLTGEFMGHETFWPWLTAVTMEDPAGYGRIMSVKQQRLVREHYQRRAYILTRKDAGLGETKIYQPRSAPLPPVARAAYDHVCEHWAIPIEYGTSPLHQPAAPGENDANFVMVVNAWAQRICSGFVPTILGEKPIETWKLAELERIVTQELPNDQIVVWCAFNAEVAAIYYRLNELGVTVQPITGEVPMESRREIVNDFQSGRIRVVVCQIRCARFGLNFSVSDTAVYYSNTTKLEDRAQSEDRIVDPVKKRPLLYIDFVSKDTVEEGIYAALRAKKIDASVLRAGLGQHRPRP